MDECKTNKCKGYPNFLGFCKHCTKKRTLKYNMENFNICKVDGCYQMSKKEDSFCGTHIKRLCMRFDDNYYFDNSKFILGYMSSIKRSYIDKYFFILLYPKGKHDFTLHMMHDKYVIAITPRKRIGRCYLFGPIRPINIPHNTIITSKYLLKSKIDRYVFEGIEPIAKNIGLILIKHIILIQRAWKRCRYDPKYLMCRRIQLRELADLGVIEVADVPLFK